jgi:hypothetical protein
MHIADLARWISPFIFGMSFSTVYTIMLLASVAFIVFSIVGLVYCGNLDKAKMLRTLGIVLMCYSIFGLIFFVRHLGFSILSLIEPGIITLYLVGAQMNVKEWENQAYAPRRQVSHYPTYSSEATPQRRETTPGTDPLIKRAFMLLEDGDWDKADELFEQRLNANPEDAKAYVGKLCVELQLNREADLLSYELPINENNNYKRAVQFADKNYKTVLEKYAITPEQIETSYQSILSRLDSAVERKDANELKEIRTTLMQLGDYKDASKMLSKLAVHVKVNHGAITAKCPACGESNGVSRPACSYCGVSFIYEKSSPALAAQPQAVSPKFCGDCGNNIPGDNKFCNGCGKAMR